MISPVWDFLLLGGGSVIAFLIIAIIFLNYEKKEGVALSLSATLFLSNFINHPHFAHSYQIFYSNFRKKIGMEYEGGLRIRYFIVGVILPPLIIGGLVCALLLEQPRVLGLAANAMFFFVGWHYVKQGYGMAMLDAALKRRFFDAVEKKTLLHNAYAAWIFSWILINFTLQSSPAKYFGVSYFVIPVPVWLLVASAVGCLGFACKFCFMLLHRSRSNMPLPINGIVAYVVTLYIWLLFRDPITILWIPLFHSLQYLTVVWRFKINKIASAPHSSVRPLYQISIFAVVGFGLGYLGFWKLPEWLDANISYNKEIFGSAAFFYISWIFINVHHYFIDSIMWRKGNKDVMQHLFESGAPTAMLEERRGHSKPRAGAVVT
ncbi:hypothetical protein [Variovorax paradoxus]|uniref:hypothetical protein n=1 Tax=Variovorax paradoxus TaxID=34073 RepID=UPI003ED03CB4